MFDREAARSMKPIEILPQQMIPQFPPGWAEASGEDDQGIFAECSLDGVSFVWRWIFRDGL